MSYDDETLPWSVVVEGKTQDGKDVFNEEGEIVIAPYRGCHIVCIGGSPIAEFLDQEYAERIVACVHACKGISLEELQDRISKNTTLEKKESL